MWHLVQGLPGEQLVQELMARCGIDEATARRWIEGKTGARFDSRRRYRLRLPRDAAAARGRTAGRGAKLPPHETWGFGEP